MGALTRGSAGAIGHGHEIRRQRRQPVDGLPQAPLHVFRLGRKELEGDFWRMQRAMAVESGGRNLGHGTSQSSERMGRYQASRPSAKISQRRSAKQPIMDGK